MFWVVQQGLFHDFRREELLHALDRLDINHQIVDIDRHGKLTSKVDYEGDIITNGSIALSMIANSKGWKPGSLFNDNFSYEKWLPYYQEWALNGDAEFTTVEDAEPMQGNFFVRPLGDCKEFDGFKINHSSFLEWQKKILALQNSSIKPTTPILISSAKKVGVEIRHYIVNGKVISSSVYRMGGSTVQNTFVDRDIIDFVEERAKEWSPAPAFVMDTHLTDGVVGIIEIGSICHAGFYKADVHKIVAALDSMEH